MLSILFHCFLPFFKVKFIIPSSQNVYLFEQRTVLGVFYSLQGIDIFFLLREFCKDFCKIRIYFILYFENKEFCKTSGSLKVQCLAHPVDESEQFLPGRWRNLQSCVLS